MLGIHIGNWGIATSSAKGNTKIESPYLDWLINKVQTASTNNTAVMYHLDANVASLLRLIELTEEESKKLLDKRKLRIPPYSLTYYPGKFLGIDRGYGAMHPYANFYNAGQYLVTHFEPDESLDSAISKAKEAADVARQVTAALHKLGLDSSKLTSPVRALDSRLEKLSLPTVRDIPLEAGELAYECVKGNWLEAFACGYWKEAYDYDINGAYGSELMWLPDLRQGEWKHSKEQPTHARYGFARGELTVHAPFHPFLMEGSDMSYTPVGSFETCLTLSEIRLLERWKLGEFKIKDAWWWVLNRQAFEIPLHDLVSWLYYQRGNGNSIVKQIARRCIAGIWGRFLEFRGNEFGPIFNPVYGAVVENNIRCRVAGTCYKNRVMPLHVAVDGLITDRPMELDIGENIGQWRLSHKGQCIIVSSGIVGFEGKNGAEEFSLKFNWLYEQMKANPGTTELKMRKWSSMTLAKALNLGQLDKLGKVEEIERAIYLEPDYKRVWKQRPANAGEILDGQCNSEPIEASIIKKPTTEEVEDEISMA